MCSTPFRPADDGQRPLAAWIPDWRAARTLPEYRAVIWSAAAAGDTRVAAYLADLAVRMNAAEGERVQRGILAASRDLADVAVRS